MDAWTETRGTYVFADIDQGVPARETGRLPPPAGDVIEGDPAGAPAAADAAEELFRSVYPTLAGWVRRRVDDNGTAHEIASEAFARLLSRWTRVASRQPYLYVIAANLIRDHWRTIDRERRAIHRVTLSAVIDLVTCPAQDVDVRDLIASLPPRLRDPFLLRYYGDLGIREVAALLRKPEGTSRSTCSLPAPG
jgi:RNA polymerase sigma-70 factor, ECF subfamily